MRRVLALIGVGLVLTACGLDVEAPDLFLLARTGEGSRLTMLINNAGTISCDRHAAKQLPDPLLLDARGLVTTLAGDAQANLHIRPARNSVYMYTIKLQAGTISFPDTAGATHPALAQAESFALQAAQQSCGVS